MSAEQLEVRLEAEASKIRSIKGQARLKIDSPQQKGVLEVLVAAQLPDAIHLELLDGLGRPVRIFVSKAGRFELWDIEKNVFYRGLATQRNLERFLPLYFSPQELVLVLLGAAPRLAATRVEFPGNTQEEGRFISLELKGEKGLQRLRVHTENFRVEESEVWGDNQVYKLAFASFIRLGAKGFFPEKRVLEVSSSQLFLELSYTDYSLEPLLEDKLFTLVLPQGIRRVEVEEAIDWEGEGRSTEGKGLGP